MADSKKYYYIKLQENFFEREEILILESAENGYLYSNILLKLYLKSLKNEGKLMFNNLIPYTPEILAKALRHNVDTIRVALKLFVEFGLIEILDNGAIYMNDIQNFIGESSTEADRKREWRRKIEQEKVQLTGQMSDECPKIEDKCPDISPPELRDKSLENRDKSLEIKDKSKKKKSKEIKEEKETIKTVFEDYTGGELLNVLMEFAEMRKAINAKLTPRAAQMICNKLDTLADNDIDKIKIVENSIMNSWKGIFALKQDSNTGSSYKQQPTTQDLLQSKGVQAFLRGE